MCVRVLINTMSIRLSKDNHDSWVTCTTSAECKTIIIAALTVMSGMDPHMISGNLGETPWRNQDRYLEDVELLLITSILKA
jgi:hypothetical protein